MPSPLPQGPSAPRWATSPLCAQPPPSTTLIAPHLTRYPVGLPGGGSQLKWIDLLHGLAVNLIPEVLLLAQLWGEEGQGAAGRGQSCSAVQCGGVRDGVGSEVGEVLPVAVGWGPSQGDSPPSSLGLGFTRLNSICTAGHSVSRRLSLLPGRARPCPLSLVPLS